MLLVASVKSDLVRETDVRCAMWDGNVNWLGEAYLHGGAWMYVSSQAFVCGTILGFVPGSESRHVFV